MKKIGFPISDKLNENRRALTPSYLINLKNPSCIYIEKGYGEVLGYSDEDYVQWGIHIATREQVLKKDIICDPKVGDADYLNQLNGQIIFGWIHAIQNIGITNKLIENHITAYAWEDMFDQGRHVFWRNNEIAGEAAIVHAYTLHGLFPYNTKVALIGRGNIARGALKVLTMMGAEVTVYDRRTEAFFRKDVGSYDVLVNGVLWNTNRKDHIIYKEDLKRMKKGALIIDISCDRNGGFETSVPTTLNNPTYIIDNIVHYVVDHTPTLFHKTVSDSLSENLISYLDDLIEGTANPVLESALIIKNGSIIDQRINDFQGR
ncbi:N5-(carboxyethyl)ornithine synthase [Psychrobacter sp. PL19]|uniref:N(5)-(carboxyethyl)ornithine synthase n=1 Tax=Psychrobacter sp. PL19 TaxID=2760711 RepID=UPI001AE2C4A4